MNNAILDCIKSRRSIRKYQSRQISPEQLNMLLEAAIWAPSGHSRQSWLFTAIQNQDILAQLNQVAREALLNWPDDEAFPEKKAAKAKAKSDTFNFFYHAPTLIVASNIPEYKNGMADCATALQNIMLTAHSIGLGSCWINQLRWLSDDPSVREFLASLGLPKEHVICGSAAIGYADISPAAGSRKEDVTLIIK